MRKILLIFCLSLSWCLVAAAQSLYRYGPQPVLAISSTTSTPFLVALISPNQPIVSVCNSPAVLNAAGACINYATTYTSAGVACPNTAQDTPDPQPSACQASTDAYGNVGFWAPAGSYTWTACVPNSTCYGPYTVSIGGTTSFTYPQTVPSGLGAISQFVGPPDEPFQFSTQGNNNFDILTGGGQLCFNGSCISGWPIGTIPVSSATTQGYDLNSTASAAQWSARCMNGAGFSDLNGSVHDFGYAMNRAITAAVAFNTGTAGPACVDMRSYPTEDTASVAGPTYWIGTLQPFNGITQPVVVYWPCGRIYTSIPILVPAVTGIRNIGCGNQALSNPMTRGNSQLTMCKAATPSPDGCGTNPASFPDFSNTNTGGFSSTWTSNSGSPLHSLSPSLLWVGGGNTTRPITGQDLFHFTLEEMVLDCNNVAISIGFYSSIIEEGSGLWHVTPLNCTEADVAIDRNDASPGAAHYHLVDVNVGGPTCSGCSQPAFGFMLYGSKSASCGAQADGPSEFVGLTITGAGLTTYYTDDGVYADCMNFMQIRGLHCEYIGRNCVNLGAVHTTTNVSVEVSFANPIAGTSNAVVNFGSGANSSDKILDVNCQSGNNIALIDDTLLGISFSCGTYGPSLHDYTAGGGFSPQGQMISGFCNGAVPTTGSTQFGLIPWSAGTGCNNGSVQSSPINVQIGVVNNLFCLETNGLAGSTMTVFHNGSATNLKCTFGGGSCASTNSFVAVYGDYISINGETFAGSNDPTTYIRCSLKVQ